MPTLTGDSVRLLLDQVAIDVESNKDFLCDLDGEVGDGDHGGEHDDRDACRPASHG